MMGLSPLTVHINTGAIVPSVDYCVIWSLKHSEDMWLLFGWDRRELHCVYLSFFFSVFTLCVCVFVCVCVCVCVCVKIELRPLQYMAYSGNLPRWGELLVEPMKRHSGNIASLWHKKLLKWHKQTPHFTSNTETSELNCFLRIYSQHLHYLIVFERHTNPTVSRWMAADLHRGDDSAQQTH